MTNVLVVTGDRIGPKMAGPAIRAWNISLALSAEHSVKLVTIEQLIPVDAPFEVLLVRARAKRRFARLVAWADVIIFQGHIREQVDAIRRTRKIVVADVYDPMHLEMLEQGREQPRATWDLMVKRSTVTLNGQFASADFFLCASERQRLFYLGQLAAVGRLTPATYENDPYLTRLLAVVPFGLDPASPVHEKPALRGQRPGFGAHDKIILWGGGIYSWFDPGTLIRAVAALSARRPNVRLFFLGTKHPVVEEMGIVGESVRLALELGALDRSVFFNDEWVEFADRQNYLLEADAGVSTHQLHIETMFSFRTRILDYLWAGLPMVVTEGDSMAELVQTEGLGIVVPAGDAIALELALERVLFDEEFAAEARKNVARVAADFTWSKVLEPLVDFVRDARHAADRPGGRTSGITRSLGRRVGRTRSYRGLVADVTMAGHHLRHSGVRAVLRKMARRLRLNR